MPENKEMLTKVLKKMDKPPKDKKVKIPGYGGKPYKLHIKAVKVILKPDITIRKAEREER